MNFKKLYTLLILVVLSNSLLSQITRQWVATYNGSGDFNDRYTCVTTDASGNIYIGGSTTNDGVDRDYLVVKLTSAGAVTWSKQYSGSGLSTDEVTAITVDVSGNVYVTGFSKGDNTSEDYLTIKYNSNGDTAWTRRYDFVGEYDQANSIFVDGTGNVYVTGQSDSDVSSILNDDYYTIKYSASGNTLWTNRFNGLGDGIDRAVKVVADGSGNVYITGRSSNGNDDDYVTIKYNNAGAQQWIKYDDRGGRDRSTGMAIDASNNIYITGLSDNGNNFDYWTLKYDAAGTLQWQQPFDFVEDDRATAIVVDAAGNCYITGQSDGDASANLNYDYQTVAYNTAGTQIWQKRYDGTASNDDTPNSISVLGNAVYITGLSDADASAAVVNNIVTRSYATSNGIDNWIATFAGSPNNDDEGFSVVANANGCVAVGFTEDANIHRNAIAIQYNTAGTQSWTQVTNGYGDNNENVRAIAVDASFNVYAAGYSVERGVNRDFALVKFNSTGNFVCNRAIDGTSTGSIDDAQSLALDNAGNVILAGFTKNRSTSNDIQIGSFDTNCDTVWTRIVNGQGNGSDKMYDMASDGAGNFYITGRVDADPTSASNDNCYTTKFNASGTILWQQTYNSGGSNEDRGIAIRVSPAGNVYVTGRSWNGTDYDLFIIKYNGSGAQQWLQTYSGGNGDDEPKDMAIDGAENIYVTGNTEEVTDSVYDYVTLKYSTTGAQTWVEKYNGTGLGDDEAVAIAVDGNGAVVVTGKSDVDASTNQNYDIVTVKYDTGGNQLWVKNYNGTANTDDTGDDVVINGNNLIYVTGHTNKGSVLAPNYDAITKIFDAAGNELWSDIFNNTSDSSDVPNLILLSGNDFYIAGSTVEGNQMRNMMVVKYSGTVGLEDNVKANGIAIFPNPFTDNLNIKLTTPGKSVLVLVNSFGQKVFEHTLTQGSNNLLLPELSAGMYFYQIQNNGVGIANGKIVRQNN